MGFGDSLIYKKRPYVECRILGKDVDGIIRSHNADFLLDTGGSVSCLSYDTIRGLDAPFLGLLPCNVAGGLFKARTPIHCGIIIIIPVFDRNNKMYEYSYETTINFPFRSGVYNVIGGDILHKMNVNTNYLRLNPVKIMDYDDRGNDGA